MIFDSDAIMRWGVRRKKLMGCGDKVVGLEEPDRRGRRTKRTLDVAIAGVGVLLTAPLLLLIALMIKLDSPGSVIFVQERLGRGRVPFPCFKFRTMREDAEGHTGPIWARPGDPRITRVGGCLRAARLDELPQLLNVLRGEMSLVGPRPIRRYFADQLAETVPSYNLRFLEKPGLTGWAQIKYRYAASFGEQEIKFLHDYYYIKNRSTTLDLYIIMLTPIAVLRGERAMGRSSATRARTLRHEPDIAPLTFAWNYCFGISAQKRSDERNAPSHKA